MMWGNVIPKGKIANQLSSTIDLLPTIATIVKSDLPDHKIDGVNFVNPSEIFAKLLDAIPKEIPIAKNKYPNKGFILIIS